MSKIHPAENKQENLATKNVIKDARPAPCVLTVWKRSSMSFQGTDGFTVFDRHGRLVFRVDNYTKKSRCAVGGGLVLMDGRGKALLSLKPQIFSMQYQWNAHRGEDECGKNSRKSSKVFTMKKPSVLLQRSSCEAEVYLEGATSEKQQTPDFRIEGSFRRRNCKIRNNRGEVMANMARKKVNSTVVLGDDVFSLVIQPGYDPELVMAFVMVLDRISLKPFSPFLCS